MLAEFGRNWESSKEVVAASSELGAATNARVARGADEGVRPYVGLISSSEAGSRGGGGRVQADDLMDVGHFEDVLDVLAGASHA